MAILPSDGDAASGPLRGARDQVEGGQIRTSVNGGVAVTEAAIASISPSCDDKPFIFQFPAIKGRMFYSRFRCERQTETPSVARVFKTEGGVT